MTHDPNCIFCKIVTGEVPAYKILENDYCVAFLDIFPTHKGQTLVIPKEHLTSNWVEVEKEPLAEVMESAQQTAKLITSRLPEVERILLVVEGLEVNHLHIKLYPALKPNPLDHVVSTSGKMADQTDLQELQKLLTADGKQS